MLVVWWPLLRSHFYPYGWHARSYAHTTLLSTYLYIQQQEDTAGWSELSPEVARWHQTTWAMDYAEEHPKLEWIDPTELRAGSTPLTSTDRNTIWVASPRDHTKEWLVLKYVSKGRIRYCKVIFPPNQDQRSYQDFTDHGFEPNDLDRYLILGGLRF